MTVASDNYEKFIKRVLQSLLDVDVHHQRAYTGRRSQRRIKVDVSFNYEVAGAKLLFLVECKCYNYMVPVADVEEFHSKIDDIGAHKGIMVTTVGFQEGAVKTARGRGIALALLTKKRQPGELVYVVNSARQPTQIGTNNEFWQGNLRGPLDSYTGGFWFESIGQFLGMMCFDASERERERTVAAFERSRNAKPPEGNEERSS